MIRPFLYRNNLTRLAEIFGTDKAGSHFFTQHYQKHFEQFRNKEIVLLEIGIGGWSGDSGGYSNKSLGGASLRMWKAFFRRGKVYGLDIEKKDVPGIKTFQGSQDDEAFLKQVIAEIGNPDIIIDDGSHRCDHVIKSFEVLFPLLKTGGIYAIEDLQTSYWDDYRGESEQTSMDYLKNLADGINFREYDREYVPNYFDENITAVHFYHNLCFIEKNLNDEPSNLIG